MTQKQSSVISQEQKLFAPIAKYEASAMTVKVF